MTIDNLDKVKQLIANSEGIQIEFKETTGQLERGMETLCAFLNAQGGYLIFGVNDSGKIIGQEISDKTKRDIAEALSRIEPFTTIDVSYVPIHNTGKNVIIISVQAQELKRPFMYKGKSYVRSESVTKLMPYDELRNLFFLRGGDYAWEKMPNPSLKIEDLNEQVIMNAVRGGVRAGRLPENTLDNSIQSILEKFRVMQNGVLNNAAAVLFGNQLYGYPQCLLRLARFKGTDKTEFIDNQRVEGNIYELLDASMAFFFKHLNLSGKIEGLYRTEELSVPYNALRECCINALAHRFYHISGISTSIAIYDDRIEVTNGGELPKSLIGNKLIGLHESLPHNPIIANVLYRSGAIENWGRGIQLMIDECKKVGIPEPEFYSENGFVQVVFHYIRTTVGPKHPSTTQVPPKYYPSTTQVMETISIIGKDSLSAKQIMDKLKLKSRKNFVALYLKPAINEGFVELLYPYNPKHPKQQYFLSLKGKEYLEQK